MRATFARACAIASAELSMDVDAGGVARERREREAAGVAEHVQHPPPARERAHDAPVVALVEIEPRLLARDRIDAVRDAVLDDGEVPRELAVRDTRSRRKALERADFRIGALVHAGHAGEVREGRNDRRRASARRRRT